MEVFVFVVFVVFVVVVVFVPVVVFVFVPVVVVVPPFIPPFVLSSSSSFALKFIGCNNGFVVDCNAFIDFEGDLVPTVPPKLDPNPGFGGGFGDGVLLLLLVEYGGV